MSKIALKLLVAMLTSSVFLYTSHLFAAGRFSYSREASFRDDLNYLMATTEIWYHMVSGEAKTPSEFIEKSRVLMAQYKTDKSIFPGYKHSEKAEQEILFLFEQTMHIYNAAALRAKSMEQFKDLFWKATISTRNALFDCQGYATLRGDYERAAQIAIQEIQKGGENQNTLKELQYVYAYRYQWEDILIKKEQAEPPKSGADYIALAEQSYEQVKNEQVVPPSQKALVVVSDVVAKTIIILKAINQCTSNFNDFLELAQKDTESISRAFEGGLVTDKSLDGISQRVAVAVENSLRELSSCSSQK